MSIADMENDFEELLRSGNITKVWLDVGAHKCETTLGELDSDLGLMIVAFEPLPHLCASLRKMHPRLIAVQLAVGLEPGYRVLYQTSNDSASSLRKFDEKGLAVWGTKAGLDVVAMHIVQVVRLDTLLGMIPVPVEYINIDTQGNDLDVVKSAGKYLRNVKKVKMEVVVLEEQLYEGAATRSETISYMHEQGFKLVESDLQTENKEENLTFEFVGEEV